MKMWLLTSSSEDLVEGVFSSREKALEAVAALRLSYANDPEEFEVDDPDLFDVEEGYERGSVFAARIELDDGRQTTWVQDHDWYRHPERCEVNVGSVALIVESPISEEHAAEVATERHKQWLRERGRPEIEVGGTSERPPEG